MKIKIAKLLFLIALLCLPAVSRAASGAPFDYTPLEKIPGAESSTSRVTDFYTYIQAVYKFGIWAVGIAALLMISIGAFMYITSAGNNASMEKAKGVIMDALIGLILALTAYLLLFVINPDLVKISQLAPGTASPSTSAPPTAPLPTTGTCKPATSGPCSPSSLLASGGSCFGALNSTTLNNASAICLKESGNIANRASGVDKCIPGNESVSWGLFQINLTNHTIGGYDCSKAFSGLPAGGYTGKASSHNCTVNQPLYGQCTAAASTPANNIALACTISNGGTRWNQWGANTNKRDGCHF